MSNIITGAGQFFPTERPWKIMKNTFYFILTTWIYCWQIRFCIFYIHFHWTLILNIKSWFPFNFVKTLQSRHLVVGGSKSFKRLSDIRFENSLQYNVLASLLLFSLARYYADLDEIHWTEIATSIARNFDNNWPIFLNFSNMINLCTNIWFIKNSKCQQFVFWKRSRQKTQFFHIFKGRYFVMAGPVDTNFGVFWEIPVDLSKTCGFATFAEI